jgi:hypothetical protein
MKTNLAASPIYTQGIDSDQISSMDMDLEGMKQACQIFRDNIYTDKILAVVREWTCNAVDEHVKHNIDRPVRIGIVDSKFFVRDYAMGLDDNGIRNIFGKYFRSTKSNSDQPIGGFGVGAKAGHCYNDVFYVTSFHNGTKTQYSCILGGDESGASIGQVVELSQEPTTESGLLVEIDLNNHLDGHTFYSKMRKMETFMNSCPIEILRGDVIEPMSEKTLIFEKDGVKVYNIKEASSNKYTLTMGGVHYKMPDGCKNFSFTSTITPHQNSHIQIDVPIGFFDVPISRESFRDGQKFKSNFEKCEKMMMDYFESEKSSLKKLDIFDIINNISTDTQFFSYAKSNFMAPDLVMALFKIGSVGDDAAPFIVDKKSVVVATVSNHYAHKHNQIDKLIKFAKDNNVRILTISENDSYTTEKTLDKHGLAGILKFKKCRSVLPKAKTANLDDGKYSVYRRGHGNRVRYTPLELHNAYQGTSHMTVEEVQEYIDDIFNNGDTTSIRKIVLTYNGFIDKFSFQSSKLINSLKSMGYYETNDSEYQTRKSEIEREQTKLYNEFDSVYNHYLKVRKFLSRQSRFLLDDKANHRSLFVKKYSHRIKNLYDIISDYTNTNDISAKVLLQLLAQNRYLDVDHKDIKKVLKSAKKNLDITK